MATTRTFQAMLNEWLNYDLLREEFVKRDWLLMNVDKDNGWKGGTLPVPFKGAYASSVSFGSLTAESDISEDVYVRGQITSQPEVWGSMKFNHRDLMEHNGRVKEQSFLKLLPNALEDFMDNMKNMVSQHILAGTHVATLTQDGDTNGVGVLDVDRPERFTIGQKLYIDDDDTAADDVYVIAIDMNTARITVSGTRGGAALTQVAYTTAQNAKLYLDGAQSNGMTNLRKSLLSFANGGEANLYGQAKTAYPYLQSINIDGSGVLATNAASKIFDAFTTIKNRGRGNPNKVVVSFKWLANIMKEVESSKGAFKVRAEDTKANLYGWTEITIVGVRGVLTVVGVQEMDDDVFFFLDMRALKFHSNNFFQKRTAPDGKQFYEVRATSGYSYIVDIGLFGDLVLYRPSYCGVMHSIP